MMDDLSRQLDRTEAIKREMAGLLRELEEQATGVPVKQTGYWRHHPTEWSAEHPGPRGPSKPT